MFRAQSAPEPTVDHDAQTGSTSLDLPEFAAWAYEELSGYSEAEIDRVIDEWRSQPQWRSELYWLEGVLASRRGRASSWSAEVKASLSAGFGAALSAQGDRCCSA
jgi:hypothetical protein